ncbi:ribosomal protein S18-alanine N-acetyltransferase [Streptococcus sp. zg-JUN1979]|uniref:ribosomal protein S18-alanine N-acetyltransferase n=1 Tax=Streptococcus sp. zg-JUN1979 TaxID=3391450 RepID=UPI0039A59FA8
MSKKEQADLIYEILCDVYTQAPWTYEQVKADLDKEDTDYFFVYDKETMVGFLALQQLVGECEVTNIAVKKDYQGQGYGRLLLDKIAAIDGDIFLEVRASNHRAKQLYQSAGFKVIGMRHNYYKEPLEDAIIMKR